MNWILTLLVSGLGISMCTGADKQPLVDFRTTQRSPTNFFSNWTAGNLTVRSPTTPWGRSKTGLFVIKADSQNDPAVAKIVAQLREDRSRRDEETRRQERLQRLLTGPALSEMYSVRLP
jgi:hypothetical protein